jgi:hypothetical protein
MNMIWQNFWSYRACHRLPLYFDGLHQHKAQAGRPCCRNWGRMCFSWRNTWPTHLTRPGPVSHK